MLRDFSKHPIITGYNDLIQICRPLLNLDITYFAHARIDKQGTFTFLSTNRDFSTIYTKKNYFNADIHLAQHNPFGNIVVWDSMEFSGKTEMMLTDAIECGNQHVFTLCKESALGNEFYHFASRPNNRGINQVYINNIDKLEKFIEYFNFQISENKLLSLAYSENFGYSLKNKNACYQVATSPIIIEPTDLTNFYDNFENTSAFLSKLNNSKYLTPSQVNCLRHLRDGKSAKLIARELNLSHRTVEHHLEKIRKITGYNSSKEIIASITRHI